MGIFSILTLIIFGIAFLAIFILYKIAVFLFKTRKPKNTPILEEIKQLNLDDTSIFLARREIDELPKIISKNERIGNIVQGRYNDRAVILVATNRRLIFIDKGLFYGLKVEDFPIDKISSIQHETSILSAVIKINNSGNQTAEIKSVLKISARKFCEFVSDLIAQTKEQKPIIINNTSESSVLDEIEKLARLRNSGILTEEEFIEKKKKMLEKI